MLAVGPCIVGFRPSKSKCCTFLLGCLGGLMTQSGFTLVIQSPPPTHVVLPSSPSMVPLLPGGLVVRKTTSDPSRGCMWHILAQCSIRSIPLHWSQGTGLIHTVAAGITASAGTRQGLCLTLVHQTLGCSSRWGCIHHKAGPTCGLSARWLFVQACLPQSWGSGELDLIQPSKLGDPRELNPGSLVVLLICFSR